VTVCAEGREGARPAPTKLSDMVGAFKSLATVAYIRGVENDGWEAFYKKVWQRDFYDHIIRNEHEQKAIEEYIIANPYKWAGDPDNPVNIEE